MTNLGFSHLLDAGLPALFLWLSLAAAFIRMAKRKGTNTTLAAIGAFPLWAPLFAFWLIFRPDMSEPLGEEEQQQGAFGNSELQ